MKKPVDPEKTDQENPEWSEETFKNAVTLEHSNLPDSFKKKVRLGRPPKTNPKICTTIRFDADIIEAFKTAGPGWQSRMNNALRDWLKTHSVL